MDEAYGEAVVHLNGVTYSGIGLVNYLKEHRSELTEQAVLEQIAARQAVIEAERKQGRKTFGSMGTFNLVRDEPEFSLGGKKTLYQGDALFMAILCKRYDLAGALLKQKKRIIGGGSVVIYNTESSSPILCKREHEGLLELLLEDETVPEELWRELWKELRGYYTGILSGEGGILELDKTKYDRVLRWLRTLESIKRKRPDFFREMVTEQFLTEILWAYTAGYEGITEAEETAFCKKWKKVLPPPTDRTLCMKILWNGIKGCGIFEERIEREPFFARLWKRISGRRLVLDLRDDSSLAETVRKRLDGSSYDYEEEVEEMLLKIADVIVNAESMEWDGIFRYVIKDKKCVRRALELDLITKGMVPEAVKYARKNDPDQIALLLLKQHGEFKPLPAD